MDIDEIDGKKLYRNSYSMLGKDYKLLKQLRGMIGAYNDSEVIHYAVKLAHKHTAKAEAAEAAEAPAKPKRGVASAARARRGSTIAQVVEARPCASSKQTGLLMEGCIRLA